MVTTLGRTGSTWLVRLLEQHPGVVAYRPFFYEPRVASYWMGVLKTLSDPASYLQGLLPDLSRRQQSVAFPEGTASYLQGLRPDLSPAPWWTGENRPSPLPPLPPEPDLRGWLGGDHVESLAAFCCGRIDAFYEQVAAALGRPGAPYFVEKVFPDRFILPALHELYPGAKEILLVRDFRDMVCSIAAFTAKRGYAAFGRQHARDEAEHIRNLRGRAVCMLESWQRRSDRAFLLHYEDLIERPEETLGAALRYLGLDDDPGLVERMIRQATELRPDVQKDHQTSAGPRESVGRWRRDLSPALLAVCQESFGDVLRAFGYEDAAERPAPDTYEDLPRELRDALRGVVPLSATVAVVSKGDDQLLDLDGRPCRHFPEVDGIYAGYAPADSAEAIAWLEAAREAGVEYLVFPWTALWWLEYYDGLARHLEANYRAVRRDRVCAVFALARGEAPDKPGARATGGPRTGA